MSIFLDTSFLFALYRIEDENNRKAVELAKLIENKEFGSVFISAEKRFKFYRLHYHHIDEKKWGALSGNF
ncbi:hypothetical protein COT30_02140 [Candidatus Micrarchaeota archaeon CG08_land_8_20_14_0_20_49_17]|nr:MAG: hypothetical protein COT30_02140 [Candidatus Micrarchaeota archaeon CG08_land_8_20_14_0_20_49_17]PIZ98164.1 MAG: hypothetical protein COX84_02455 [Candidatus Micrarchaeota archaeon CG_4_10_14_0_2_um_filter_49_7]HII53997.1 hypothetical protein [Candidatus Micrarchaeota archaeon]